MTTETQEQQEQVLGSMDDLASIAVDHAKAKAVQKELTPPTDNYISQPPLTVTAEREEKTGRLMFRAFGTWIGKEKGERVTEGFNFSPVETKEVARFGAKKGQEVYDKATINYQRLLGAFKKQYGRDAENMLELKQYLESASIGARGTQFETEEGDTRFSIGKPWAVTA